MMFEGEGKKEEAFKLFLQAWNEATDDFERFIAAHYVARHQESITDKLKWDEASLNFALKIEDDNIKATLPSLYLNIGKCNEDLNNIEKAKENYELALSFTIHLAHDGYSNMIRAGIKKGLERVT